MHERLDSSVLVWCYGQRQPNWQLE